METFEILGFKVKLGHSSPSMADPSKVLDLVKKELNSLPDHVKKASAAQQLLLVALKIASDKLILKNKILDELDLLEQSVKLPAFDLPMEH